MSYDVSIWCVEPFGDRSVLPDARAWTGDDESWSLEGRGWILRAGPSDEVDEEDLPDEVRGALPGIQHVVHLSLEPIAAPRAGRAALKKAAKAISVAAHGVVHDPQTDTLERPSGVKRYVPPGRAPRASMLTLGWWMDHAALLERARLERFLNVLETYLPEALPRRYGPWEPPKHDFAKMGRGHLVRFLAENLTGTVVWSAHRPVIDISFAFEETCGWRHLGDRTRYRCNHVSIELEEDALDQPGWQTALRRLWRTLSLELRPFYGDVRSGGGHIPRSGTMFSDNHTEIHPIQGWWWMGIPPRLGHAAVFGEPYLPLWPNLARVAETRDGLAFVSADDWRSSADATLRTGAVPKKLALPFMAHWGPHPDFGGQTMLYPDSYPPVFPFATGRPRSS